MLHQGILFPQLTFLIKRSLWIRLLPTEGQNRWSLRSWCCLLVARRGKRRAREFGRGFTTAVIRTNRRRTASRTTLAQVVAEVVPEPDRRHHRTIAEVHTGVDAEGLPAVGGTQPKRAAEEIFAGANLSQHARLDVRVPSTIRVLLEEVPTNAEVVVEAEARRVVEGLPLPAVFRVAPDGETDHPEQLGFRLARTIDSARVVVVGHRKTDDGALFV